MNIMMSVNSAWNIWNFRRPLVEALVADGHAVTVLAPHDESLRQLERMGCRVHHLEMNSKGLNPLEDLRLLLCFRRIFQHERPDIVLSFTIKNNIFGALAAKSAGVPFIPNVTGLGTAFLSGGALEKIATILYKVAFRGLPVIFFQNEDDKSLFLDRCIVQDSQARLLPGSGVDLKRFVPVTYPSSDHSPIFLMIARLLRDKGVLEYVEAARLVKANHPQVRFQILGAADAQNRTAISRDTVMSWEENGIIEYLGAVDDVRPAIAAAHCVVLPSYREGAPRTLIEAAAMARPLISTDVPGCRAVVDRAKTGLLCPVRDAQGLADAIERFLALDLGARTAMGLAGRDKMEREYDMKLVIDAYKAALSEVTPA